MSMNSDLVAIETMSARETVAEAVDQAADYLAQAINYTAELDDENPAKFALDLTIAAVGQIGAATMALADAVAAAGTGIPQSRETGDA